MFNKCSPDHRAVCNVMWYKYGRARQTTGDNTMRRRNDAIFMPDN
jgi:hypothetical protein